MAKHELKEIFSKNLRALRIAKGLTQSELSERAGISLRFFQKLEQQPGQNITLETAQKLAEALDIQGAELFSSGVAMKGLKKEKELLRSAVVTLESILAKL